MPVGQCWIRNKNHYYVTVDGKQTLLCPVSEGKERAEYLRAKLVLQLGDSNNKKNNIDKSKQHVEIAFDVYKSDELASRDAKSLKRVMDYYRPFLEAFGKRPIGEVEPDELETWIKSRTTWNNNTQAAGAKRLSVFFRYARRKKWIKNNPMEDVKRPQETPRGEEVVISDANFALLMSKAKSYMQDIMLALWTTGARPDEVLSATADEYDDKAHILSKKHHKNKHKGKSRQIVLPPEVVKIIERNIIDRPTGYIFTGPTGSRITPGDFRNRLLKLAKRCGIKDRIIPYGFRHSWATKQILALVPDVLVASLLGHEGTKMLHRHYASTLNKVKHFKADYSQLYANMRTWQQQQKLSPCD